jgi:hypothetical protein
MASLVSVNAKERTSVAAVISDSKGKYLKQQVVRAEDRAS